MKNSNSHNVVISTKLKDGIGVANDSLKQKGNIRMGMFKNKENN